MDHNPLFTILGVKSTELVGATSEISCPRHGPMFWYDWQTDILIFLFEHAIQHNQQTIYIFTFLPFTFLYISFFPFMNKIPNIMIIINSSINCIFHLEIDTFNVLSIKLEIYSTFYSDKLYRFIWNVHLY